jgi:microcin C transport system substrate-binding protein
MFKPFLFAALIFFVLLPAQAAQFSKPQTALAMTGDPLYPPDFTHFAYANPDAPKGGILKLGTTGTFDSLNPFIVRGQPPFGLGSGTMSLVYESLMTRGWDEPFTLYGLIASSVEVADDRSGIIFNLNKTAHFSDGSPITADDVLFSYQTLRDEGRPNHRTYYKKVSRAKKLSPTRVEFTFKPNEKGAIDREMPLIMGLMPIMPKNDWQDRDFNQTTLRVPIGSGPYKIASVDIGRKIVYERDPNYWAQDLPVERGLYNFDKIQVDYYRDDNVSLQAFKAGQYDVRREADPTKWATAYDFPAVADGRVRLEQLPHRRTEPAYGYIMNTRRLLFADPVLRAALENSFDFNWVNRNLFHGQFTRVDSYFPNSELAANQANPLTAPSVARLAELAPAAGQPVKPPEDSPQENFRDNLLKAETMLREGGYKIDGDRLFAPSGEPVSFEILLNDPIEEKIALNWAAALKRLGIEARVHTVDSAQYQARLAAFDFDVTANKWANSLSPGNEQTYFFGSAAADQKGSRNYAGVKDPAVDALAAKLPDVKTHAELVATTRDLDRALMQGNYFIPLYYLGADDIASWTRVEHPSQMSLYGNVMESWWANKPAE